MARAHLIANTLTAINTVLLISSGMTAVSGLHAVALRAYLLYCSLVSSTLVAATAFLSVQAIEYMHLYWCINAMWDGVAVACRRAIAP